MKQCPKCQANVSDSAKFCIKCGFNIKKYEEENSEKSVFCPECGTSFSGGDFCPECGYCVKNEVFDNNNGELFDLLTKWEKYNQELEALKEKDLAPFFYEKMLDGSIKITGLKSPDVLNITVPEGVSEIGEGAFEGCNALVITLNDDLLKIGKRAFANSKSLFNINFPESLMVIGDEAFMGCSELDAELPESVRKVGENVFEGTLGESKKSFLKDYTVGNIVTFGSYYYENENSKAPIEWRVLKREGNRALLASVNALDCKPYLGTTWCNSQLRGWLNGEFFDTAFSKKEQERIISVDNINSLERNTEDKIFLPLILDLTYDPSLYEPYIRDQSTTPYAKTKGFVDKETGGFYCWLRSRASKDGDDKANYFTTFRDHTIRVDRDYLYKTQVVFVRPLTWISLG